MFMLKSRGATGNRQTANTCLQNLIWFVSYLCYPTLLHGSKSEVAKLQKPTALIVVRPLVDHLLRVMLSHRIQVKGGSVTHQVQKHEGNGDQKVFLKITRFSLPNKSYMNLKHLTKLTCWKILLGLVFVAFSNGDLFTSLSTAKGLLLLHPAGEAGARKQSDHLTRTAWSTSKHRISP